MTDPEVVSEPINIERVPDYELRDRTAGALKRIGVTAEQLTKVPNITSILKETRGGISFAIESMRFSDGELTAQFLAKWDAIGERDLESLSIEAVAVSCGLDVRHLWGEIMLAMRERSVSAVKVLAVSAHPEVIKKRIEYALLPQGYRDRDSLDNMLGASPRTAGTQTFIDKFFAVTADAKNDENPEEESAPAAPAVQELVDDEGFIFPDCEVMQERIQPIRQKLLEGKPSTVKK